MNALANKVALKRNFHGKFDHDPVIFPDSTLRDAAARERGNQ